MIWTREEGKWAPEDWEDVNYGTMPKAEKPDGTTYDDTTGAYTYEQEEQKEAEDYSLAGIARRERIAPYLALIGHLAGENDGSTSKGGHLLLAMQEAWGEDFVLLNPQDETEGIWHAQWSIKGNKKAGGSTMFPGSWTVENLTVELMASTSVGGRIILSPSDIQIKKSGNTFYPEG